MRDLDIQLALTDRNAGMVQDMLRMQAHDRLDQIDIAIMAQEMRAVHVLWQIAHNADV